jgi:hypothetical protein
MAYVAVSWPVFARFRSIDLFDPSKTALLGVIRRFPCAKLSIGKREANPNNPARRNIKDFDLQ